MLSFRKQNKPRVLFGAGLGLQLKEELGRTQYAAERNELVSEEFISRLKAKTHFEKPAKERLSWGERKIANF